MAKCSNNKNHDYLHVRNTFNKRFYRQVQSVLSKTGDQFASDVFSEVIQKYDAEFRTKEYIVVITSERLYLLDIKCQLKYKLLLSECIQIIKVKSNASFFSLIFKSDPPLILETYRRIELIMFILSQRAGKQP